MITIVARRSCLLALRLTGHLHPLIRRADLMAIGNTGHVGSAEEWLAERLRLKPLNRFERWLLGPYIDTIKQIRQDAFQEYLQQANRHNGHG